jgi:1-deoxy-D-xylulose-5-phosphate synthase
VVHGAAQRGVNGPTHHGLFDIGYLRHVPNLIHMQAKDEDEFVDMLWTMANHDSGPIAIRYPRGSGVGARPKDKPVLLEIGAAEVVEPEGEVALIGLGSMFEMAEKTRGLLAEKGIKAALINPRWIKPLDGAVLQRFAEQCKVVCTFEDHVLKHGFGAAVIEHLHDAGLHTPVVRIGWPDEFIEHGTIPILRKKHGLTPERAVEKILAALSRGA